MKRRTRLLSILTVILALAVLLTGLSFAATATKSKYTGKTYNHNAALSNYVVVDGIDVSTFQGNIDWKKVKADGIDFAIIRAGGRFYQSGGLYSDDKFVSNMKGAKANGIMVGLYFFSQSKNEAESRAEVDKALALLKSAGYTVNDLDLPLFMDYEMSGSNYRIYGLSKTARTNIAKYWMNYAQSKGFTAGIYTDLNFGTVRLNGKALSESYNYWGAQYYTTNQFTHNYSWWQYASNGKVNGISGESDMNFWYINPDNKPTTNVESTLREQSGFQTGQQDKVTPSGSIAACNVSISGGGEVTYTTAKRYEPQLTVKYNDKTLTLNKDYKVRYVKNTKVGTAYAIVIGMGEYVDYKMVPFKIQKEEAEVTEPEEPAAPAPVVEAPKPDPNKAIIAGVKSMPIKLKSKKQKSGIKLTWSRSTKYKLDYIEIYRSTKKGSGYTCIAKTKTGGVKTYLNKKSKLKRGKRYYYKVRGVRTIAGKKYYTKWSNAAYRKWS